MNRRKSRAPGLGRGAVILAIGAPAGFVVVALMLLSTQLQAPAPLELQAIGPVSQCALPPDAGLPFKALIAVMSNDRFYGTRALAVNETWVTRARALGIEVKLFGTTSNPALQAVGLWEEEGSDPATLEEFRGGGPFENRRVFAMVDWVLRYRPDVDWLIKCDDDTFLHPDNLILHVLQGRTPKETFYTGGYGRLGGTRGAPGGGGYVLSRAALDVLASKRQEGLCPDQPGEDVTVAKCLNDWGVWFHGNELFHQDPPGWRHPYFDKAGPEHWGSNFITWHHLSSREIRELYWVNFCR